MSSRPVSSSVLDQSSYTLFPFVFLLNSPPSLLCLAVLPSSYLLGWRGYHLQPFPWNLKTQGAGKPSDNWILA